MRDLICLEQGEPGSTSAFCRGRRQASRIPTEPIRLFSRAPFTETKPKTNRGANQGVNQCNGYGPGAPSVTDRNPVKTRDNGLLPERMTREEAAVSNRVPFKSNVIPFRHRHIYMKIPVKDCRSGFPFFSLSTSLFSNGSDPPTCRCCNMSANLDSSQLPHSNLRRYTGNQRKCECPD